MAICRSRASSLISASFVWRTILEPPYKLCNLCTRSACLAFPLKHMMVLFQTGFQPLVTAARACVLVRRYVPQIQACCCQIMACRVWYLLLLAMRQHISWQPWLLVWTFFPLGREGMKKESHHMASLWWLEINCNRQQNFYSSTCSLNFLRSKAMLVALTVFLCFSSSYRCGKLFDCLQLGHDFAPA